MARKLAITVVTNVMINQDGLLVANVAMFIILVALVMHQVCARAHACVCMIA